VAAFGARVDANAAVRLRRAAASSAPLQLQRFRTPRTSRAASQPSMPEIEAFYKNTGNSTQFMLPQTAQIPSTWCWTGTC